MDVDKLFRSVRNLNDYMSITESINRNFKNQKFQFNMSTVLSLKKMRSLEIEYFIKRKENGAVFLIIEQMLELSPSKTWGLLGKELIFLLLYWLDATRKHLIEHSPVWWLFLEVLLKFIKGIRSKDPALFDVLVESTTEPLLDLATKRQPDVFQRLAILQCMNSCCAGSSRKARFALRHHLEHYFVKLSHILATSGDLPTQHSILETLVHWLLPRQNLAVRQAAAAKWFPNNLYRKNTVDIFLQREWRNFYHDARDFLNSHNEEHRTILSVNCRRITIGAVVVLPGIQDRNVWMDVNSSSKSISILMHPQMLQVLCIKDTISFKYLIITEDNVQTAQLCRQSVGVKVVLKTLKNLVLNPTASSLGASEVSVEVSSRTDLKRLDEALRNILDGKYQGLSDIEKASVTSPHNTATTLYETTDEDTRLSYPVHGARRKRSGYMVRSKATDFKSPSSTSTTSLALLRDRIAAHPINFDKVPVKVSLLPKLSNVSELTEVDDRHNFTSCSTKILRSYGVCRKGNVNNEKNQQNDLQHRHYTSPVPNEHPTSCLLVATIGSDESVINDTLERLSKSKDYTNDNVVDLLVQEAFQRDESVLSESGINADVYEKNKNINVDGDNIETALNLVENISSALRNKQQNVKSDDSNEIRETPYEFVNIRKRNFCNKLKVKEESDNAIGTLVYEDEALEQFFSQHITEDKQNGINVSPTLARKINETSSESDELDNCPDKDYLNVDDIQDNDIIDCLNNILDKVCEDFDKCAKILNQDNSEITSMDTVNIDTENACLFSNIENMDSFDKPYETRPKKKLTKGNIRLKFNTNNNILNKNHSRKLKNRFELTSTKPMPPIPELKDSEADIYATEPVHTALEDKSGPRLKDCTVAIEILKENKTNNQEINNTHFILENVNLDTPLTRRKRKLYSSKEYQKENVHLSHKHVSNTKHQSMKIIEQVSPIKNNNSEITTVNVSPESTNSDTPLRVRRKRKLYSPKEEEIEKENDINNTFDIQEDNSPKSKVDIAIRSPKFTATCYKEIENDRKKNIRQHRIRIRRSKGKAQTPESSPRSKKNNDVFDALKENSEGNQNIILADSKSYGQDLGIYNFTSDSEEDEDFKKKKMEVKKRIFTRLTYNDLNVSSGQIKQMTRRSHKEKALNKIITKSRKQCNPRGRKRPMRRKPCDLVDERMREAPPEEINTSMVLEEPATVNKEPDPVTKVMPQMELLTDEEDNKLVNPTAHRRTRRCKKTNVVVPLLKKIKANEKPDNDDRTISPLPELIVENAIKDDLNDSLSSQMIMKNIKETYKVGSDCGSEPNTRKKVLDVDSVETSTVKVDVSHKLSEICLDKVKENTNAIKTKGVKVNPNTKTNEEIGNGDIIETYTVSDIIEKDSKIQKNNNHRITVNISSNSGGKSEKSINTIGKSPITAHGDMNEPPPDYELLNETVTPRNLDLENIDTSLKDYFLQLRDDINYLPVASKQSSIKSKQSFVLEKTDIRKTEDVIVAKSPTVSIPKLSYDDISQWLPSLKNSESKSSSSESNFKPETLRITRSHEISNFNNTADKTKEKCKKNKKSKPNIRSHVSSKKTINKQKNTYKLNKTKNKSDHNKISGAIPDKNNPKVLTEKDSELAIRISQPNNLDSNKFFEDSEENAFQSKTLSISRPGYDSESSVISSIRLGNINSRNTLYKKEIIQKNSETSNFPKVKLVDVITSKEKLIKPKSHTILRPSEDDDKSEISSIRIDNNEVLNIPNIETTEIIAKTSETAKDLILKADNDSKEGTQRNNRKRSLSISSNRSKLSLRKDNVKTSATVALNRQSESPMSDHRKKKQSETLSESGPSVSSVSEWFKRNTPLSLAESTKQTYSDVLQNVMEKLDTTLAEIHQSTSKKFIHLFVEVQSQLAELKLQKMNMYKQATDDILSEVAGILKTKFADLATRSQQMENDFTELLKHLSSELIKEDLTQKRAMVVLLKEDLQAVADHLAGKKGRNMDLL